MTKNPVELLWSEKYRPKKVKDLLLPSRLRNRFENEEPDAHLLLAGPAGTGKSSLAFILAAKRSFKYIDCSTNRGIDVIRNTVQDFAQTVSLSTSKKKVIILDEIDGLTKTAQNSLKATIEQNEKNAIFIVTSNNPHKIIKELHSRFEYHDFNFTGKEIKELQLQYLKRIQFILQKEGGIKIENPALAYLLKNVFPDMRKIIGLLFKVSKLIGEDKIITEDLLSSNLTKANEDLYEFLLEEQNSVKIYQYIKSNFTGIELETLESLGEPFINYLISKDKQAELCLTIAVLNHKYVFEATTGSINPLVTLLAFCGSINELLKY